MTRMPVNEIRRLSIESAGMVTLLEDGIVKAAHGKVAFQKSSSGLPRLDRPRHSASCVVCWESAHDRPAVKPTDLRYARCRAVLADRSIRLSLRGPPPTATNSRRRRLRHLIGNDTGSGLQPVPGRQLRLFTDGLRRS